MEAYEQSVARVDAALARLNATLEAYRLSGSKSPTSSTKSSSTVAAHKSASDAAKEHDLASHSVLTSKGMIAPQPRSQDPIWQEVLDLRLDGEWKKAPKTTQQVDDLNQAVRRIHEDLGEHPYSLALYILLAYKYFQLGFPDLSAGASYKALLLSDAVRDSSDEYHAQACSALRRVIAQKALPERIDVLRKELQSDGAAPGLRMQELSEEQDIEMDIWLRGHYLGLIYHILVRSLILCGCLRSAEGYVLQLKLHCRNNTLVSECVDQLHADVVKYFGVKDLSSLPDDVQNVSQWPDQGFVRREQYPWNDYEPDRYNNLEELNLLMTEVAPKLEIRAVQLPSLTNPNDSTSTVTQLGVFAKQDLLPNEAILTETSMLTANNKLQDTLCDACSADLPDLTSSSIISCPDCEAVFCSETCLDLANSTYHPAVCDTDAEILAKDVPPTEAANALYSLLLLRSLAMAETQAIHPLALKEVKYIWGDFTAAPSLPSLSPAPKHLPFSFKNNIRLPFHMLEKMNVDIFASASSYDVWIFNTLYAKFRGTASARLSGAKGGRKVRGPEVGAVHPMWCMANHSCDPNVGWEWGGSVTFTVRGERVGWEGRQERKEAGIQKGEEVLNHYCDVDLGVRERREWARGALGGDCRCERCVFEAGEV